MAAEDIKNSESQGSQASEILLPHGSFQSLPRSHQENRGSTSYVAAEQLGASIAMPPLTNRRPLRSPGPSVQGLLNQFPGQSSCHANEGNIFQTPYPTIPDQRGSNTFGSSLALHWNGVAANGNRAEMSSKGSMGPNATLELLDLLNQAQVTTQGFSNTGPAHPPTSRPRQIKNSLYDPAYKEVGLPVDPHLRALLSQCEVQKVVMNIPEN